MTPDTYLHILLAVGSGVFSAGVVYTWVRLSINHLEEKAVTSHRDLNAKIDKNFETHQKLIEANQATLKADLSGIGNKVSKVERDALRRYHNVSLALVFSAPEEKEKKVSDFLREFN